MRLRRPTLPGRLSIRRVGRQKPPKLGKASLDSALALGAHPQQEPLAGRERSQIRIVELVQDPGVRRRCPFGFG